MGSARPAGAGIGKSLWRYGNLGTIGLTQAISEEIPLSIPVFVISLPDSLERRGKIARHFDDLRLPFEFVDAVDGRNGLPGEFETMIDRDVAITDSGYAMLDVEFACALSHIKVYRTMLDRGIPFALILEDDAIPSPDLPRYLRERHYEDADITSLFYGSAYVRKRGTKILFDHYRSHLCAPITSVYWTVAYMISSAGARHMVENALPVRQRADWPACAEHFKRRKRWRIVHPGLAEHDFEESIISEHGRGQRGIRSKRHLLGVYIPPMPQMKRSWIMKMRMLVYGDSKISK